MKIAFGFDLHNTIMESNAAWVESFMEQLPEEKRSYIVTCIYQKKSRKAMAGEFGLDYEEILANYHKLVSPNVQMLDLLKSLHSMAPTYLISSSSKGKVEKDLASWKGAEYFDEVYTKETFTKDCTEDWTRLIDEKQLDLLVYIGNDIEEDIIQEKRVVSFISGRFLEELLLLDMLKRRGEEK